MRPVLNTLTGRILFWLSLPLLVPQAMAVRRRALRLPAAGGPDHGVFGQGDPLELLALGDSIIAGVGAGHSRDALPAQFAAALASPGRHQVHWLARGDSGDVVDDLLTTINTLDAGTQAHVILVSIGVNEVTGLSSSRKWRRGLQQLIDTLRSRWPHALLMFLGLPPMADFPALPQPLASTLGKRAAHFDRMMAMMLARAFGP